MFKVCTDRWYDGIICLCVGRFCVRFDVQRMFCLKVCVFVYGHVQEVYK